MANTDPEARIAGELYTAELLARMLTALERVTDDATLAVQAPEQVVAVIAAALYAQHVGLVDLTRRQALVDERVYGAALGRLRRAEQLLDMVGLHLPAVEMTAGDLGLGDALERTRAE